MAHRKKTAGRKPKPGPHEPNGRPQRTKEPDIAILLQRAKKAALTRSDHREITPLGILVGHGLISEAMYAAADRYRTMHWAIFSGGPDMPMPFLAKLPSDQWPEDIDEALRRQAMPIRDEKKIRTEYDDLRLRLTHDQQEIVHTLAVFCEWPHILDGCKHEIISHRLRWDDEKGVLPGLAPSNALKKAIADIREAFTSLLYARSGEKNRLTQHLDENDLALVNRMR